MVNMSKIERVNQSFCSLPGNSAVESMKGILRLEWMSVSGVSCLQTYSAWTSLYHVKSHVGLRYTNIMSTQVAYLGFMLHYVHRPWDSCACYSVLTKFTHYMKMSFSHK